MPQKRSNRKTYRRKSVAKKKVDRKQSTQIARLARAQYTKVYTMVQRDAIPIGPVVSTPWGATKCYIQPISPAMEQGIPTGSQCSDNLGVALPHQRKFMWGTSAPEFNTASPWDGGSGIKTTFCKLNYRLQSTEENMVEVCVAVISPKKRFADQISISHQLKDEYFRASGQAPPLYTACAPGSKAALAPNMDFSVTGDPTGGANTASVFGCQFNKQLWNVHYQRNHRLQSPSSAGTGPVGTTNTRNAPNDQFGTINLPLKTYLRAGIKDLENDVRTGYASNVRCVSVPNEECHYLVAIANDGIGSQTVLLSTNQNFTHRMYKNSITGAP